MTISPVAAPMAAPTSAGPSGGSASTTDFEALVQQHLGQEGSAKEGSDRLSGEEAAAMLEAALLAGMLAGPRAAEGGTAPEGKGDGTTGSGTGASESAMLLGEALAARSTSGGAAPGTVPPGAPLGGSDATVVAPGGTGTGTGNGGGPVAVTPTGASGGRADVRIYAADVSRAADEAAGAAVVARSEQGDVALPATASLKRAGSAGLTTVPSAAATDAASPSGLGAAGVTGVTSADSSVAGGATAGGGTAGADVVRGNPVADQVFGHVTRLVSRGDGTHRLMLRLHPADLGEVKVVLTVRDNTVDVTLSAGPAARDALRDGSPQLRALLELAGATTGQVVIRDHAGAATFSSISSGGQQPGSEWADQNGDPQGNRGRDGDGAADSRADAGGSSQHGDHGPTAWPRSGGLTDARSTADPATSPTLSGPQSATQIPTRLDLNL